MRDYRPLIVAVVDRIDCELTTTGL